MGSDERRGDRARWSLTAFLVASCLAGLVVAGGSPASAQEPPTYDREHGYIDLPDGVRLKYTAWLPPGDGPWPTLLQYEGYNAGSFPDRANQAFVAEVLTDGYAVVGVSVRGTACSGGVFDVFDPLWGEDGAYAVDWVADRPWSDGRVGMFSLSFGGIMQLWTAANQPEHLLAIAPGQVVGDIYRDVSYPGGVLNAVFPGVWMAALQQTWAEPAPQALQDGDAECLENIAAQPARNAPYNFGVQGLQHPYADDWHDRRSVHRLLDRIEVPVLGMQSWQDEQTGSRGGYHVDELDPETTWFVSSNGPHGLYGSSPRFRAQLRAFFDHTVKGLDNGFDATPRVEVWHETLGATSDPTWVTSFDRWPIERVPLRLHLDADGRLGGTPPGPEGGATSYLYPVPGPAVVWDLGLPSTWTATPIVPAGTAAWTTSALPEDVTVTGEASADLWITTTAPDADLQVTVTEVRPDGQEVYVQRGWLRLSHRAIDETRSDELRPFHPHTAASLLGPPQGAPELARVEILPFGHTFRAGSAIRLWVDAPSVTGIWGFLPSAAAGEVTIHHDADAPSSLVLGTIATDAPSALPACGTLSAQPCRPDPLGIPAGDGTAPPDGDGGRPDGTEADDGRPADGGPTPPDRGGSEDRGEPLPVTGAGPAGAGLVLLTAAALLRGPAAWRPTRRPRRRGR